MIRIGYVSLQGRGATDACIAAVVQELRKTGARLAGTVQTNFARAKDHPCDMDLLVLPSGPTLRISQDLGPGARGCRLNGGVLEEAVMLAAPHLAEADVLVVNKFGKLESEGRGFVPLIAEAIERGISVLAGVNGLNFQAFMRFTDDCAIRLSHAPSDIAEWLCGQTAS